MRAPGRPLIRFAGCAALLTMTVAAHAQSAAPTEAPAAAELTRLLNEFLDGASRNDLAAHQRFWAEDLVYTRSAGVRIGKAQILADVRTGPHSPETMPVRYSAEEIRIQQYGDTAVVAFRLVGTMGGGAGAMTNHYLNTGTFVRRDGEWRAVAWQSTRVPDPREETPISPTPGPTPPECSTARTGP